MTNGLSTLIAKAGPQTYYHEYYGDWLASAEDIRVRAQWAQQDNLNPDLISKRFAEEKDDQILNALCKKSNRKSDVSILQASKKYKHAYTLAARLDFTDTEILNLLQLMRNDSSAKFKEFYFCSSRDRFFLKKRPKSLLFLLENSGKDTFVTYLDNATTQEHVDEITRKLKSFQPDTVTATRVLVTLRKVPWGLNPDDLKKYYGKTKDVTCKKLLEESFAKTVKVSNFFEYNVLETLVEDKNKIKSLTFQEIVNLQNNYLDSRGNYKTSEEVSSRDLEFIYQKVLKIWWDNHKANLADEDLKVLLQHYFHGKGWKEIQYSPRNCIFPEIFTFVTSEKLLNFTNPTKGTLEDIILRNDRTLETAKILPAQKVVISHPDPGLILKELAESSNKDLELIETLLPTFTGTFGDFLIMLNSFKND